MAIRTNLRDPNEGTADKDVAGPNDLGSVTLDDRDELRAAFARDAAGEPMARVFNIQKFSLNDGPGIRTVVFLKGCPLRCRWCANPESQLRRPQIQWERRSCRQCGHCVAVCPHDAVTLSHDGIRIDPERCDACGMCLEGCPGHALNRAGRRRAVADVLAICLQDEPFYQESGGGVTLSGGEPLVWPEFCVELLGRLRARGVDTCIETTALASEEVFDRVSAQLDHLLIDMKHWDPARHEAGTGVGDERILANTARAIAAGKDVLVRIPVIPGFNDSPEDARGFCRRLREVGASRVQLLPFHQFGESKYETLEYDYDYAGVPSLSEDALEAYRQTFVGRGVDAFF